MAFPNQYYILFEEFVRDQRGACEGLYDFLGVSAPEEGIPYEVKTLRSHSTFGRNFHAGMGYEGFQGGVRHSDMADRMSYTYVVYVRRRDYARARALLG